MGSLACFCTLTPPPPAPPPRQLSEMVHMIILSLQRMPLVPPLPPRPGSECSLQTWVPVLRVCSFFIQAGHKHPLGASPLQARLLRTDRSPACTRWAVSVANTRCSRRGGQRAWLWIQAHPEVRPCSARELCGHRSLFLQNFFSSVKWVQSQLLPYGSGGQTTWVQIPALPFPRSVILTSLFSELSLR